MSNKVVSGHPTTAVEQECEHSSLILFRTYHQNNFQMKMKKNIVFGHAITAVEQECKHYSLILVEFISRKFLIENEQKYCARTPNHTSKVRM